MGFNVVEWALFYASFSAASWALYSFNGRRSRYTLSQWLDFYQGEGNFNPVEWAEWVCGVTHPQSAASSSTG